MKQTEHVYLGQITPVSGSHAQNNFDFPLGQIVYGIYLRIKATVTVSGSPTNYVAVSNPILNLVNNIQFELSKDGMTHNAPGAALYHLAALKTGTAPRIDNASFNPNSAAAYAMSVSIPLLFCDPLMARPEDTALDMSRYTSAILRVLIGSASDVVETGVGSGGTFALSAMSCDVEIERYAGPARDSIRPLFFPKTEIEGSPKNVASDTSYNLTRSSDRALKRVLFYATNGGSLSRPFSGLGSSAIVDVINFGDERNYYDKNRRDEAILDVMKLDYAQESTTAGLYLLDYVADGSNFSAVPTGDKGALKLEYTVDAAAPATLLNMVSVVSETVNLLKD